MVKSCLRYTSANRSEAALNDPPPSKDSLREFEFRALFFFLRLLLEVARSSMRSVAALSVLTLDQKLRRSYLRVSWYRPPMYVSRLAERMSSIF